MYTGCKKNEETPLTQQLKLLKNGGSSWVVSSVIKDTYDVTDQFVGFTISFDDTSYTTTNSLNTAWLATGTWAFQDNNPDLILREDGTSISVSTANNQLVLSFFSSGPIGGRVEGVSGDYVFTLISQ